MTRVSVESVRCMCSAGKMMMSWNKDVLLDSLWEEKRNKKKQSVPDGMNSSDTTCFQNLTDQEIYDIKHSWPPFSLDYAFRAFYGWMMLPVAIIGFIFTFIFVMNTFKAIRLRRVSRKCYVLLLNRAIGDLLMCIAAIVSCFYVLSYKNLDRNIVMFIDIFVFSSFYSALISYTALSVLKLFAVWRPFHYRKWFTMKRCIYLMVVSWIVFLIVILWGATFSFATEIPALSAITHCKRETCLRIMYRSRNIVLVVVYFFVIAVFLATVIFLKQSQAFSDSFKKPSKNEEVSGGRIRRVRFPLWKLGLNVATFAVINAVYVVWCIYMLSRTDKCYFQQNYVKLIVVLAFVRLILMTRLIIDPVLSFITDHQVWTGSKKLPSCLTSLRRLLMQMVGLKGDKIVDRKSTNTFKHSTYSTNSSMFDQNSVIDRSTRNQTATTIVSTRSNPSVKYADDYNSRRDPISSRRMRPASDNHITKF